MCFVALQGKQKNEKPHPACLAVILSRAGWASVLLFPHVSPRAGVQRRAGRSQGGPKGVTQTCGKMRTELYAGVLHDQFTVLYPLFLFAWLWEASDIAGPGGWP